MKRFIMAFVCLMAMVSVSAQINLNEWVSINSEASELICENDYTNFLYQTEVGTIILWGNNDRVFSIVSNGDAFAYKLQKNGATGYRNLFMASVGIYDRFNRLVKEERCWFEVGVNSHQAIIKKGVSSKNFGKKIIKHLCVNKGYVRIKAALDSGRLFDFKIPCMSSKNIK
jgi:hypothetical protein